MRFMFAVTLFLSLAHHQAQAETIGEYLSNPRNRDALVDTLKIVGVGISSANSYLNVHRDEQIYCPPRKMTMTGEQYLDILSRFVLSQSEMAKEDLRALGPYLVLALADTFPCAKQ